MQLLTFTNLYPSSDRPRHGVFVEERLRHLVATAEVSARVLALRPGARPRGEIEGSEVREGIAVDYCSVPSLPLVTNWLDPLLWARATERIVRRMLADHEPIVLDAHFLYPDGVAAVILGARLGLPVVMTARGSDVNVKCENPIIRAWVRWAATRSAAIITVSRALAARLDEIDVRPPVLEVLPNGVDTRRFRVLDRGGCRAKLKLEVQPEQRLIVSVGHLVPEKGHDIAIDAVAEMPDVVLAIVGDGPEAARLKNRVRRLGMEGRVLFLGLVPYADMPFVYSAADALVLASLREGMPNVVLESLACGTRVAATSVGGVAEVVTEPVAGILMEERTKGELTDALAGLFRDHITREQTRLFAEKLTWDRICEKQIALYRDALQRRSLRGPIQLSSR